MMISSSYTSNVPLDCHKKRRETACNYKLNYTYVVAKWRRAKHNPSILRSNPYAKKCRKQEYREQWTGEKESSVINDDAGSETKSEIRMDGRQRGGRDKEERDNE
jgi:hypothetical protein